MTAKSAAEKMGLKPSLRAYFQGAAQTTLEGMRLPPLAQSTELIGEFDYIHLFVRSQAEMKSSFCTLVGHLDRRGSLWLSWPKGRAHGSDLTLRDVIRIGYDEGLVESTTIALDNFWSAMKFTHPKPGREYRNSYGKLRTREVEPRYQTTDVETAALSRAH